ncbi:hypothetical protein WI90_27220 [Burkholderia ubonensis]|nr:hypothetical protein WI90_27220 [Burkholderia ubonensis]
MLSTLPAKPCVALLSLHARRSAMRDSLNCMNHDALVREVVASVRALSDEDCADILRRLKETKAPDVTSIAAEVA